MRSTIWSQQIPRATSPGVASISRSDPRILVQQSDANMGSDNIHHRADTSLSVRLLTYSTLPDQYELFLSPIEQCASPAQEAHTGSFVRGNETGTKPLVDPMETDGHPEEKNNQFLPFSDPAYWELPFLQG